MTAADIEAVPINNSTSDNLRWNINNIGNSHFLHRFSFQNEEITSDFFHIFRLDLKFDFDFEYFQVRPDYLGGYGFSPLRFLHLGPLWGLYYNYMGNSFLYQSTADTQTVGDKNSLYLIDQPVSSTGVEHQLVTIGPHIFGGSSGFFLAAKINQWITALFTYQLNVFDYAYLESQDLNSTANSKSTSILRTFNSYSEWEIKFYIHLENLGKDYPSLMVAYRNQFYPALAVKENGFAFGVVF
ncbi:MAG: hypothetical protein D6813_14640 [Calditrichaeota bacterium]|nr:MAG: hypothetical protein D6813_14640 [Calditrichota bacterium]